LRGAAEVDRAAPVFQRTIILERQKTEGCCSDGS